MANKPTLAQLIKPFADAFASEDSLVANLRVQALELGGEVLDATARMTDADRKAAIEKFIADVCKVRGYAESSVADRKSLFRAMIYASPHKGAIIAAADYAVKNWPELYQRSRMIERAARHVKSRLNKPAEITQKALKAWIDADSKGKAKAKAKSAKAAARGPMGRLQAALAHFCADVDWDEAIAAGYVSKAFIADARKLHASITPGMVKQDAEWAISAE